MFGTIVKATNSSFQKGMTFCRSIYVKKAMKLLALIFEQSLYYYSCVCFLTCMSLIGLTKESGFHCKIMYYRIPVLISCGVVYLTTVYYVYYIPASRLPKEQ